MYTPFVFASRFLGQTEKSIDEIFPVFIYFPVCLIRVEGSSLPVLLARDGYFFIIPYDRPLA